MAGWWFGTFGLFFHVLGIIIPTDKLIFFGGVGIPPTSLWLVPNSCYTFNHENGMMILTFADFSAPPGKKKQPVDYYVMVPLL